MFKTWRERKDLIVTKSLLHDRGILYIKSLKPTKESIPK